MKRAIFYGPEDMRLEEVPAPSVADDEALLRVKACSVCGTDLKIYHNGHQRIKPPRVIGHEIAGEIAQLGKRVSTIKKGDRVVVAPAIACGNCKWCSKGLQNMCTNRFSFGYEIDGAYAEFMRIPREALASGLILRLADDIGFEEASLTEPLACVVHGQSMIRLESRDTVVVLGGGPIGSMHLMLAKTKGARVLVSEISKSRIDSLRALGADVVIDASRDDAVARVLDETDGDGAQVVIVASPNPILEEQAVRMAAKRAQILFFAGLPQMKSKVVIDSNLVHYRELSIVGSFAFTYADFREALSLIESRAMPWRTLITRSFALRDIGEAIKRAEEGRELKIAIAP
jgi:L-iditol 2-dehydrogenase